MNIERPCYVIASNGMRESVSYEDDWCYGPSRWLGDVRDFALNHRAESARELIKAHIRQKPDERNGLPLYHVSDHGNVERRRRVTLRRV